MNLYAVFGLRRAALYLCGCTRVKEVVMIMRVIWENFLGISERVCGRALTDRMMKVWH